MKSFDDIGIDAQEKAYMALAPYEVAANKKFFDACEAARVASGGLAVDGTREKREYSRKIAAAQAAYRATIDARWAAIKAGMGVS